MNFASAARSESYKTFTDNGATAYKSTGNPLLDLFSSTGAMRAATPMTIETMLANAYTFDKLNTAKLMFYTRDIRGDRVGKGERNTFRIMLKYMANQHPEAVIPNIPLIGVYGRFDDLFSLIDTPCEAQMWAYMKEQLESDIANMEYNKANPDKPKKPVSLLAKWLKSIHASSAESRAIAKKTYKALGLKSEKNYRNTVARLREYIPVIERLMSDNNWDNIDYEHVPALAMKTYRQAFARHGATFQQYLDDVKAGKATIKADTLFPYDIVGPYLDDKTTDDDVLEAQWNALPNFIDKETNTIVICDVSGSMYLSVNGVKNLPIKAAIGLALYFAERNTGAYHNLFMTFSSRPQFVSPWGETLEQKIRSIEKADWGMSTNMEAAFMLVLDVAIQNHIPQEEMPKSLVVITDMQIDSCSGSWSFYSEMKHRFAEAGYDIPHVVFWNVNASRPTMLVDDRTRDGVQLISGLNAKTFAEIIDNIGKSSLEIMETCLSNPRYDAIHIAE